MLIRRSLALLAARMLTAGAFFALDRYMDRVRFQRSLSWNYSYGP